MTTEKVVGAGEDGEICLKCPTMMLGYHKNNTATTCIIDRDGWLHTGKTGRHEHK